MKLGFRQPALGASIIVTMSAVVATVGFEGVFATWAFLAAAVIGAVGAAVVATLTRAWGLLLAESIAASLVAFIVLGGVASGGVPTPGAYADFFDGLVSGWARLLSSTPPAALTAEFRVMPYTVAWMSTMVACAVLRSERRGFLAIVGPIGGLIATTAAHGREPRRRTRSGCGTRRRGPAPRFRRSPAAPHR